MFGGRGSLLLIAQKPVSYASAHMFRCEAAGCNVGRLGGRAPPIGWTENDRAGALGSLLSGGTALPLSSAWYW
eukprot:376382-Prymnesium_polylepis.2